MVSITTARGQQGSSFSLPAFQTAQVQFLQGHGTSQWVLVSFLKPHLGTGYCCALEAQGLLRFTTFPRKIYTQWARRGSSLSESQL